MSKYLFAGLLFCALLGGCSESEDTLQTGYYSAVGESFNKNGWKPVITLFISNNRIVTVEFNGRNASGLAQSWDVHAQRQMKAAMGVHPNHIIRAYMAELLHRQDPAKLRKIPEDIFFYDDFKTLAVAALANARQGDKTVAEVALPPSSLKFQIPKPH